MKIETIPGARLKQGYTIPFNLPPDALEELRQELKKNEEMGVLGDAPMGSTLHGLLTVKKATGGHTLHTAWGNAQRVRRTTAKVSKAHRHA